MSRIFSSPSAHDVERITAKCQGVLKSDLVGDFTSLSLCFESQGEMARMSIFGTPCVAEKFDRLAKAINDIFGETADNAPRLAAE